MRKLRYPLVFVLTMILAFILGNLGISCIVDKTPPPPPARAEHPPTSAAWSSWWCYRFTLGVPGSAATTWRYRIICRRGDAAVDLLDTSMKEITILNIEYFFDP